MMGKVSENKTEFSPKDKPHKKKKPKVKKVRFSENVTDDKSDSETKRPMKRKMTDAKDKTGKKKIKLFNMKRKERKLLRKKKDKSQTFERGARLKLLWEELRRDDCNAEKKQELLDKSFKLIKGHAKELSYAHDTVRVLECVFAVGTDEHKTALFDELKDVIMDLVKSKYGKFLLIKVFQHGSKSQKNYLLKQFHGKVIELISHTEAASVIEVAFSECANAVQRAELVQEFYGPNYRFFKESDCHSLKQLLQKAPEQKAAILQHMKEAMTKLLHKSVIRHSIVHFIFYEFLTHADSSARSEIIEGLREIAVEMLHTKEGSRAAMQCLWHGTAKDRKAMIKSFKTHVAKIAKEEYGHMVLLALFDCVDDTKLVEKHIISELTNDVNDIIQNLHGRKVLLYLLTPRDSVHFHPDVIRILEEGDHNETSKKDRDVRRSELKQSVVVPLVNFVANNAHKLYTDNGCCVTMLTILKHAEGVRIDAYKAIAKIASEVYSTESKNTHIVESSGSHFLLKKLIADDKTPNKEAYFSEILIDEAPIEAIRSWTLCNRGCFLLVSLLETEIPSVSEKIKEALFGLHKQLAKKTFKAAEILLKKLK